jgi:hypothetical protein
MNLLHGRGRFSGPVASVARQHLNDSGGRTHVAVRGWRRD